MAHRPHSSPIKKERLKLVLKEKGMTIQSLCDALNCNRTAFSRAINRGFIDSSILTDIAEYLRVDIEFLDGRYPLLKLKPNAPTIDGRQPHVSPSGYYFPGYGASTVATRAAMKTLSKCEMTLLLSLVELGRRGIRMDDAPDSEVLHWGRDFVYSNSQRIVERMMPFIIETCISIYDEAYTYPESSDNSDENNCDLPSNRIVSKNGKDYPLLYDMDSKEFQDQWEIIEPGSLFNK